MGSSEKHENIIRRTISVLNSVLHAWLLDLPAWVAAILDFDAIGEYGETRQV